MDVTKKEIGARAMTNGKRETGNGGRERENNKWKQNRECVMKLLIGIRFNLGFVPISYFPVPRFRNILFKLSYCKKNLASETHDKKLC